ncbi:MAG: lysophospholipid acyltransferase family protein [Candidatus Sulfobium sp.]
MALAEKDTYRTVTDRRRSLFSRIFLSPKFTFYPQVFRVVWTNSRQAKKARYGDREWVKGSLDILHIVENVGVEVEITGMENITRSPGPVVFVANHMSTLETFVLPCIIQPVKPVAFVVKSSLLTAPVFGHVMRSRDPVAIDRKNPREDLKTVLEGGRKKLESGISVIIFPQSTRSVEFRPEEFNSLGVKLAARAGAPVIPVALKTDAWGIGKKLKELGPVDTHKKVFFAFGEPLEIEGRGAGQHEKVIAFIKEKLDVWQAQNEEK